MPPLCVLRTSQALVLQPAPKPVILRAVQNTPPGSSVACGHRPSLVEPDDLLLRLGLQPRMPPTVAG